MNMTDENQQTDQPTARSLRRELFSDQLLDELMSRVDSDGVSLTGEGGFLPELAKELERTHPGAAGSLREGRPETLTVLRLNVSPTLARTLRSTNSIESMISIARTHSMNVKNWQNGNMALRWCAAGMIEARSQFRRVNGHLHLPGLRAALDAYVAAETVGTVHHDEPVIAA